MAVTIYIKNMVCLRCKMAVQAVLQEAEIPYLHTELGWVQLSAPLSTEQTSKLTTGLTHYGLELMENKNDILVERIKTEIRKVVLSPHTYQLKLSVHLSQVFQYNYTYLANIFSEQEGSTLERYFIGQRVERAKELMVYDNMTPSQIAYELQYSSVAHFCLQFKKVAGLTPAEFKRRCQSDQFIWRAV